MSKQDWMRVQLRSEFCLLPTSISTRPLIVTLFYCSQLCYSLTFFPRLQLNVLLTLFLSLSLGDGLFHLKLNTRPGATPEQPSVRPCLTLFSFFPLLPGRKKISKIAKDKNSKTHSPFAESADCEWHLSAFSRFRWAFIWAFSSQSYNCLHVISFVLHQPWDAKVNYSLAVQVQLDDNYTTAGSRGGKQFLSVWACLELIRWFSSFFFSLAREREGREGLREHRRV